MNQRPRICFLTGSAADWGGASRVLYTTLRSIDLSRIDPLILLSGTGPIQNEFGAKGIRCRIWGPLTEPTDKIIYLRALFRSLYMLRSERIAAMHVNHRFWRPAEVLAALLLRIPVLVHFHVVNSQEGSFMRYCRAAICVSRYVANHSLPAALKKEVIYNPVDSVRFAPKADKRVQWGFAPHHVVIAFIGQIRDIKGVQDFIAMARRLPQTHVRFLIAGECRDPTIYPGSFSIEDLRKMIGGDARIRFIGYVTNVEDVYNSADIIVVPSRWQEPLGLINLEAGACGKPVVATRVGGIPEIVREGVNGFLIDAQDIEQLTAKVNQLIGDPELRRRLGEGGCQLVENDFKLRPIRDFENLLLDYVSSD
jgi:glycosyltransferase involved in cell wall biosynthesis